LPTTQRPLSLYRRCSTDCRRKIIQVPMPDSCSFLRFRRVVLLCVPGAPNTFATIENRENDAHAAADSDPRRCLQRPPAIALTTVRLPGSCRAIRFQRLLSMLLLCRLTHQARWSAIRRSASFFSSSSDTCCARPSLSGRISSIQSKHLSSTLASPYKYALKLCLRLCLPPSWLSAKDYR
jgi:hypothetical protein